jgi:GAF sensor hybrid histidine kinase
MRYDFENKIKQLTLDNEQQQRRFATEQLEQRQQVWVDSGIAMLSTLMAQNQNNLKQLCEQTLARLTKYMRVNAAMLYVARVDLETHTMKLYMHASFGLTREQIEKYTVLDEDQGLIGACYRDNTFQHISNLPEGFIKISSGLGNCTPPALLLMPLQSTAGVVGVLELGRFEDFQEFEITFIKRIAVILANNLIHTKNNEDYIVAMGNLREEINRLNEQIETQSNYKEQLEAELEEFRREI